MLGTGEKVVSKISQDLHLSHYSPGTVLSGRWNVGNGAGAHTVVSAMKEGCGCYVRKSYPSGWTKDD